MDLILLLLDEGEVSPVSFFDHLPKSFPVQNPQILFSEVHLQDLVICNFAPASSRANERRFWDRLNDVWKGSTAKSFLVIFERCICPP